MSRTNRRKGGDRWFASEKNQRHRSESSAIKSVAKYFQTDNPDASVKSGLKHESKNVIRVNERKQLHGILKKGVDLSEDNDYDTSPEQHSAKRMRLGFY